MVTRRIIKVFLILISMTVFLSSCSLNNVENPETSGENEIRTSKSTPFTIVIPEKSAYNSYYNEKYIELVESQMKKEGFSINIEIVPRTLKEVSEYTMTYKEYVEVMIEGKTNVVFAGSYFAKYELEGFVDNKLIMELSGLFEDNAPSYYYKTFSDENVKIKLENSSDMLFTGEYDPDMIYGIPVGSTQVMDRTVLLVRKDVADKYGKDIDSLEDYEELLNWIWNNTARYRPGLISVNLPNATSNRHLIFNFFVDMSGYGDILGQLGRTGNSGFFYKNKDLENILEDEWIDIVEVVNIPGFKEFMLKLIEWRDIGMVDFWTMDNLNTTGQYEYATVITNIENYIRPGFSNSARTLVAAQEYDMYLLNKNSLKNSTCRSVQQYNTAFYIGAKTKNPDEILEFIEWLYSDKEHYELFIYGIEPGSTVTDRDRVSWGEEKLGLFVRYDHAKTGIVYPDNWEDILEEVSEIPDGMGSSLYDHVAVNTSFDYYELDNTYDFYIHERSESEELSYAEITADFLQIFSKKDIDTEYIIDEYILDVMSMKERKNMKDAYKKYINTLFDYLNEVR